MLAINDIEKRALEIAAYFDEKDGKRQAEIIPGVKAKWHMARTAAGKEGKAANQLADFGFGAFVPKFDEGSVLKVKVSEPDGRFHIDQVNVGNKLIFPCRVFFWVWDVMEHWRRITRCTDISSIVVDSAERPVTISDEHINRIQVLQFSLIPKDKKKRKRYQSSPESFLRTMQCKSYWTVDDGERNRALDRELGLSL